MYQGWDYQQFLQHVVIENGKSKTHLEDSKADRHQCYLSYHSGYQVLESIGTDLIEYAQNGGINPISRLHTSLLELDARLTSLMDLDYTRYDQLISIIKTVNSIPQSKIEWLTNLLANLSTGNWESISYQSHKAYIQALGPDVIDQLKGNELVDILSQMDRPDLILTSSYLFPLLKMLFCVFGWSKATPHVIPEWSSNCANAVPRLDHRAIYQYISQFETVYPNLAALMGDSSQPPPNVAVRFSQINPGFADLANLSEYLWRFNDYAYCCHLREYDYAKIPVEKVGLIANKVCYLRSL